MYVKDEAFSQGPIKDIFKFQKWPLTPSNEFGGSACFQMISKENLGASTLGVLTQEGSNHLRPKVRCILSKEL